MMFCAQCGSQLHAGARFCTVCGTVVAAPAGATVAPYPSAGGWEMSAAGVQYAGFWLRFVALIVDGVVLSIVTVPLHAVLGQGLTFETYQDANGFTQIRSDFDGRLFVMSLLLNVAIYAAYQIACLTQWGQTLGARAVGVKVVDRAGDLLTVGSAASRFIGSYVSSLILGIGYLMMIWDPYKQTLHDKMAGSYVIKTTR